MSSRHNYSLCAWLIFLSKQLSQCLVFKRYLVVNCSDAQLQRTVFIELMNESKGTVARRSRKSHLIFIV